MPRPLCPAFVMNFGLALLDDATAIGEVSCDTSAPLRRRYTIPNDVDVATPDALPTDGGWSTAFVHHVGFWSHFDYRLGSSVWPLPATASCTELATFAARHFVLAADAPEPGDIYLLWSPAKKLFVRAGIILSRSRRIRYPSGRKCYSCLTIDGDTTRDGQLRGPHTVLVQRMISPAAGDRLIRWSLIESTGEQLRYAESPSQRAA